MTALNYAFEVTPEDIENVLRQNSLRVTNSNGISFETMAEDIHDSLSQAEFNQIASAALDCGDDLTAQTDGAYAHIRSILVQRGILD